jgi:asparagine synthase (glutamine-hydrolysing)
MCGIVGIYSARAPVDSEALGRATRSLTHRGPDGQRWWLAPDQRVGLGHARLSIIDLATGDQPITSEDETLWAVVNGEFYDFERCRRELEARGHRFRTRSDSEIVLHLYEEHGPECLAELRGEFAILLWDQKRQRLLAARDRFGIKPLFHAEQDGVIYLGSEAKALFAAGLCPRWDMAAARDALLLGGTPGRTLFAGVRPILPGHYLLIEAGGVTSHRYWDFAYPTADPPERADADWAAEFRAVLEDAIRLRLRADVPVGCYLSGGIDSCAILGLAARHCSGPLRAFTLSFAQPDYDERAAAEEMAVRTSAEFQPVWVQQDQIAQHAPDAIAQAEMLFSNAHAVAKFLLSRAARDAGYKVVLTGEGSDEILGGYMHFRQDLRVNGADAGAAAANGAEPALAAIEARLGFVPGWLRIAAMQGARMHPWLRPELLASGAGRDAAWLDELDVDGQLAGRDRLRQSLYLWSKTRLPDYLLTALGDRMEMAHSIEGRVPFLDHKVVETAQRQPAAQKIRGPVHKFVLREAVRDVVPDAVYRHRKQAFLNPPVLAEPAGRLSALVQDTLRSRAMAELPFFNYDRVSTLLDQLRGADETQRAAHDGMLMQMLSACVLAQRYRPA